MGTERKTMSADEIRSHLNISNQALANYLALGVLSPVPATADSGAPLYYADDVAVVSEALKSCDNSIKRLNSIQTKVKKELEKCKNADRFLQMNGAIKDRVSKDFIDAVALFLDKALPQLNDTAAPFYRLLWDNSSEFTRTVNQMKENGYKHNSPQDFCEDLCHEMETLDAASLLNCIKERDALLEERNELRKQVQDLKLKLENVSPDSMGHLQHNGYGHELSAIQVHGLNLKLDECGFSKRVLTCLRNSSRSGDKYVTLMDVARCPMAKIQTIRNLGSASFNEVMQKLAEYNLGFAMDIIEINGIYYSKETL